jgi:hypothetical protein
MPLSDDNKSHILRKNSDQEVSTVVDKKYNYCKKTNERRGC